MDNVLLDNAADEPPPMPNTPAPIVDRRASFVSTPSLTTLPPPPPPPEPTSVPHVSPPIEPGAARSTVVVKPLRGASVDDVPPPASLPPVPLEPIAPVFAAAKPSVVVEEEEEGFD
jgi:hypothetical protein